MSILLSFAHPDDESFFTAGITRRYVEAGRSVVLCCATRGQRGSAGDPPLTTVEELPRVRERELRTAAEIMGVTTAGVGKDEGFASEGIGGLLA